MLLIKRLFLTGIVAGLLVGACAPERAGASQGLVEEAHEFEMGTATLPVYVITAAGAPAEAAQVLADILDLPASPLEEDGALRYLEVECFQSIPVVPLGQGEPDEEGAPTILEAIDFKALYALSVLEDQDAVDRADEALQAAGLAEFGGVEGLEFTAAVDHSRLEGENLERTAQIDIPLDTQVIYDFTLDGIPLVGPGAKVRWKSAAGLPPIAIPGVRRVPRWIWRPR